MANKKTVHHRNQITALILWMRCFGRHNNKPPPSGGFFMPMKVQSEHITTRSSERSHCAGIRSFRTAATGEHRPERGAPWVRKPCHARPKNLTTTLHAN
jgi:hypothetical protein